MIVNKWGVFFTCEKDGKFYHHYSEANTMVDVARMLITFKPKRGWEVVKVEIAESEQLEMELYDKSRWED
jgi:hypothetical protein